MRKILLIIAASISVFCNAQKIQDPELLNAVKNGNVLRVKELIEKGVDVDIKDSRKINSLMYSASYGYYEIVKLLIETKADLNALDYNNNTALGEACLGGYIEIVKLLIENGALININNNKQNSLKNSPLIISVKVYNSFRSKVYNSKGIDLWL